MRTLLLALLLLPATAGATTGLEWNFAGEHRYVVQASLQLHAPFRLFAQKNLDARAWDFSINLNTLCKGVEAGKKKWAVTCQIDDISFRAAPVANDKDRLLPILNETDELITGAQVTFMITKDGRVRDVDLVGYSSGKRRTNQMEETLRQLMSRVVAPFDLELPRKGDDLDAAWEQRQSLVTSFPSNQGTVGVMRMGHKVDKVEGSLAHIVTSGEGTVGASTESALSTTEGSGPDMYEATISSKATFDLEKGVLTSRQYKVVMSPTASSSVSLNPFQYVQAVRLTRVADGEEWPAFAENSLKEPPKRPTAMTP